MKVEEGGRGESAGKRSDSNLRSLVHVSPPGFWRRRIPRVVSAGRRDCVRVDHDSCLRVNNDGYVRVDDDAVCICLTRPPERIQTPRKRRGI